MSASDPLDPSQSEDSSPARPGTSPSSPSASAGYVPELPYAAELQAMLEGRYIVESFLGQGGMGAVYRGLQLPLRRPVAIKILAKRGAGVEDDFAFEERFKREAYAMAALTHPHIVQVYDCGEAGENWLFISMELVEGGDLSDLIKAGQCTPEVALRLILQICDGLQAAHERGIVHRDIKPANIFITASGRAKVADFGLAKSLDANSFMTQTGMGMGTPDYAAPEQYEGAKDLDHRADIFALGVMMYQMLTGTLPRGAYKPVSVRVAVDPRLDDMVSKAMEMSREDRYQSAAELKADILSLAEPASQPARPAGMRAYVPPPQIASAPTQTTSAPLAKSGPMMPKPAPPRKVASAPTREKGGMGMVIGVLALVAVIAAGAFFWMKQQEAKAAAAAAAAATSSAPVAATGSPADAVPTSPQEGSLSSPSSVASTAPVSAASQTSTPMAPASVAPAPPAPSVPSPANAPAPVTASPTAAKTAISAIASRLLSPDYKWSEPVNLGPTVNSRFQDCDPTLSADGLILVFTRWDIGMDSQDLYEAQRRSFNEPFGEARLLTELNTNTREARPCVSPDGLTLYYSVGGAMMDIMQSQRNDRNSPWGPPFKLESLNSAGNDFVTHAPDALTVVVSSARPGSKGMLDLHLSRRDSPTVPWGPPENLGEGVNTPYYENGFFVTPDGGTLLFLRDFVAPPYERQILLATRDANNRFETTALSVPFAKEANSLWLSPDGRTLWVSTESTLPSQGIWDIWQLQSVPATEEAAGADLTEAMIAAHPKIAKLNTGFQGRYATDAQKPFEEALASLNQSYIANGIPRARAAAQAKGSLGEVSALDAEKAAMERGGDLPADTPDTPPAVKSLHVTYRDAVAKIEAKRAKDAGPLFDLYVRELNHYIFELTSDKKMEMIKDVTLLRDYMAKRKSVGRR